MFGIDDALLGGAVGAVTGLASTWWTNEKAAERQDEAQGFSAQQYATRYQTQVKDLQAAGLNPMLAYAQSPGSSPTGVAAPVQNPSDSMSKLTGALLQAVINSAQTANIQADTDNKKASLDLIEAQVGATKSSAAQADAQTRVLNASVDKVVQEVLNLKVEEGRLVAAAKLIQEQTDLTVAQNWTEIEKKKYTQALISKVVSETGLNELDLQAAKQFDNMGREAKQVMPILEMLKMFIRSRSR